MIGTPKERLEALEWGYDTIRRLATDQSPEARDDATLITTAMAELVAEMEPRSVTGQPTRPRRPWVAVPESEKRLVWLAEEYRKRIKRATKSGRKPDWELIAIEQHLNRLHLVRQDEWADYLDPVRIDWTLLEDRWRQVVDGAELTMEEARVVYLRIGEGIPVNRAAFILEITQYQADARLKWALAKIRAWIESREWDYDSFMEG